MSVFAVSKYQDSLTDRSKREKPFMGIERFEYFDTANEARQFIVDRAGREVVKAEKELARARNRYAKCLKKFPPLQEPESERAAMGERV